MFRTLARLAASRNAAAATVVVVLVIAALSFLASRRVQHEDDLLAFLPQDNPEVRAFYQINKRFGGLDVALVGIESEDVFASDFVRRLARVTRELKETPGLSHVLSLGNVMDFVPDREKGGIITGELVGAPPRTPEERAALRAKVLSRDLVVGNLVSESGKAVLLYCFVSLGTDPKAVAARIQGVVEAGFPRERKFWGGNAFISTYIYNTTQEDIRRLTPWAGLAIIVIMMLAFRDVFATVLALVSTGIGIVFSLGLMGLLGIRFNIVLGSMPIIMLALGSAYAIHVLARYYALAQEGAPVEEAVARTVIGVGPTVLAAGLTTVISLLSFVLMDIEPMRIFGLFTAIGLLAKLVLSLTFIPAVVRLFKARRKPAASRAIRGTTSALAGFARRHRIPVGVALLAVIGAGAYLTTRVDRRMDQSAFFSAGSPPDLSERYLKQHFGGSQFLQLHVRGDLNDPTLLRELQRMGDELALYPHVASVQHVAQPLALLNAAMTGQRRVPDTAAQVKLLYSFLSSDPASTQLVTADRREALMQVKLDTARAAEQAVILAEVEAWAAQQGLATYLRAERSGPRGAEVRARLEATVLARVRAAAHQLGIPVPKETVARLARGLTARPAAPQGAPVAAALERFLRSEECLTPLSEAQARAIAAALVKLGPGASEGAIRGAASAALGDAPGEANVDDLVASVTTPLRELWGNQLARERAQALLAGASLTPPAGKRGETFLAAVSSALLDLEAPSAALPAAPAAAGGATGELAALALQVTGQPVMNRGLSDSVGANQLRSLGFALLFVFVIMTGLFRSLWSGLLGMTPALFTLVAIWGAMGLLGVRLDIGTSMLGSIIVGAGVDYAIHMLAAWRAPDGEALEAAARGAADRSGLAVFCNATMIAAAFFVLTLGEAKPLKSVGGLTAAAMLTAGLATYLAIPVIARRRRYRPRRSDDEGELPELDGVAGAEARKAQN